MAEVEYRELLRSELARLGEIDRTERIDVLFVQHGERLERVEGEDWSARAWVAEGDGEHSVAAQVAACEALVEAGGTALGAFARTRLVGVGVLLPHLRPGVAQLAFLHVSHGWRSAGIGSRLTAELEHIARRVGDTEIVVSATPSENTVRFYIGRGYAPMAEPLPELLELEPEDVHLAKTL